MRAERSGAPCGHDQVDLMHFPVHFEYRPSHTWYEHRPRDHARNMTRDGTGTTYMARADIPSHGGQHAYRVYRVFER